MRGKCKVCDGAGRVATRMGERGGIIEVPCPTCNGTGKIGEGEHNG